MLIAPEMLEELLAHAREEYDTECCGMIAYDAELVGKGICNYSAVELRRVRGLKSADVRERMPLASEEAVHRDYFVLA